MQKACSLLCSKVVGGTVSLPDRLCESLRASIPGLTLPCPLPRLEVLLYEEETAPSLFSALVTGWTLGKAGRNSWPGSPSAGPARRLEGSVERAGRLWTSLLCRSPWSFGPQGKQDGRKAGCWLGGREKGGPCVWPVFLSIPSLDPLLSLGSGHTPVSLMGGQPVSRDRKMPRWRPGLC